MKAEAQNPKDEMYPRHSCQIPRHFPVFLTSGHPAFNDLVVHARKYAETLSTEVRETSKSNICLMTMHHRPPAMPAFVSAENPNYHSDQ